LIFSSNFNNSNNFSSNKTYKTAIITKFSNCPLPLRSLQFQMDRQVQQRMSVELPEITARRVIVFGEGKY
jgi:hypothetical protein